MRQFSTDSFYGLLITAAVLSLAACPFTISLNALVMVAVKTKRRLQTHPNILLACMAFTDLTAGVVVQPLYITTTIFLLQGNEYRAFCDINFASSASYFITFWASIFHMVLISGERYFAMKHAFTHGTIVTKTRLLVFSALAWIAAVLLFFVFIQSGTVTYVLQAAIICLMISLHGLIYNEAHRHEKQILSHQVSLEAKAKFRKEKKALKVTTVILVAIFLCCLLPITVMFMTWVVFSEHFSPGVKTLIRQLSIFLSISNSVVNPVIYTVRKRDFRVAFIQLLLRKSFSAAEEVERRQFGVRNNGVNPEDEQVDDGREQNVFEETSAANAKRNQRDCEDVACNIRFNTNPAGIRQIEEPDVSHGAPKNTKRENSMRGNPADDNSSHEDVPGFAAPGPSFNCNKSLNVQNQQNTEVKNTEEQSHYQVGEDNSSSGDLRTVKEHQDNNGEDFENTKF